MVRTPARGTSVVLAAAVIALVAVVVAAAALLGSGGKSNAQVPAPRQLVSANPAVVSVPYPAAVPTPQSLTATLAPAVAEPNLFTPTRRNPHGNTRHQRCAHRPRVPIPQPTTHPLPTTPTTRSGTIRSAW